MKLESGLRFSHCHSDGIKQEQPENTFSDALGWTVIKSSESKGYVSSINGNKKFIGMPAGFKLRGEVYLPEFDQWIFLGLVGGIGQVGIADEKTKTYRTIVTDGELDRPLGLKECKWTKIEVNIHANCNRVKIYFTTNKVYRVIELFDPCRDFSDTLLFKPTCVGVLTVTPVKGIGILTNGSYRAVLKVFDKDNNDTNFGQQSQPVTISDGDHRYDEETNYGLLIEGFNLPKDYNYAELVILENTTGAWKPKVINDVPFGDGFFQYVYTGNEGYYADGKVADINNKKQQYFEGDGIDSHDSALLLHDIMPVRNFNLQKYVNNFKVGYKRWVVPIKEAKYYTGLKENENYSFCVWFNGKDGTKTISYPLINPRVKPNDGVIGAGDGGNCTECEIPQWAGRDTSIRTKLYLDFDACDIGRLFERSNNNNLHKGDNKIDPAINDLRKKISTDDNVPSYICNGSCAAGGCNSPGGCSGGSCGGTSCASGSDGSDGALPRIREEENDSPLEQETYIDDSYVELCEITNCDKLFFRAACQNIINGLYAIANSIREAFGLSQLEVPDTLPNCTCQVYEDLKSWYNTKAEILKENKERNKTSYKQLKYLPTAYPCTSPGERRYVGQICYECRGGKWNYVNNVILYKNTLVHLNKDGAKEYSFERPPVAQSLNYDSTSYSLGNGPINKKDGSINLPDESTTNPWDPNCVQRLTPPIPYSEGLFGYWETNERYPTTIGRDDCQPIFREWAGKNEVLCKVPSLGREPHFLSLHDGVPSKQDMGNDEMNDGYAIFTGLRVWDITIPNEIKDWVCKKHPFTIGYAQRTEANKTVISTGILHGTFEGDIQNTPYLFPKHAVNSFEFYDANVNPGGTNTFRRGRSSDIPAYIYHSPDYHLYGNNLNGHYALFQMELFGKGYRHGLYADGKKPEKPVQSVINHGGARQGLNLNHFVCRREPIFRCIKGMTDCKANSIVGKDGGLSFTRSLINIHRESSQYIEFEGSKVQFLRDADGPYGSLNGGDRESDNSFIGDTINHETFVKNCRAHLVTIMRYLPNQYGSIISRPYIPIGLNGTAASLESPNGSISIEGIVGDSFIGPFTYKRTGHVSDKVPEDITPVADFGLLFPKDDAGDSMFERVLDFFKDLVRNIASIIGYEEIGTTPQSGNREDPRNLIGGLRNGWDGMTTDTSPIGPPSGGEHPDTYFPQLVKSYIFSFLTSDANLNYRGTGSIVFGEDGVCEVHKTQLKTMNLDSTMPDGFDLLRAWLNRVYFEMIEPSKWKYILRFILNFIWRIGIAIWIIFKGISILSFDTSGILGLIGGVLSVVAAVFVIGLGIAWYYLWGQTDWDSKVIDFMIGIEWSHPDKELRKENQAGVGARHAMFASRIRLFEDNYFYYNFTYSSVNEDAFNFAMPFYYDTEYCPDKYTNRIIASLRQDTSSEIDAWRQFKPLHYVDVPRKRGKIMDLITIGNRLFAQTTDTIFQINYRGDIQTQMTNDELLLGRFFLFGKSVELYGGVVEGAAGTKDPNASRTTIFGHFYVDRDGRRFRLFTGGDTTIPIAGIEEYMDDNIKFHLLDYFPDYPFVDQKCDKSVYFDIALDHGNYMIYFMKRDFIPVNDKIEWNGTRGRFEINKRPVSLNDTKYFKDKSFLWIYSMKRQKWISREFLRPDLFLQNRYTIFSIKDNGMWTHDVKDKFNNFFDIQYPYYIEIPIVDERLHNTHTLRNFKVIGEVIDHFEDGTWKESDDRLFDKFQIYTGRQNTGWITLRDTPYDREYNLVADSQDTEEAKWFQKGNAITVENFRSKTDLTEKPLDSHNIELDILDVKATRHLSNGTFEDDYFVLRLLSFKKPNQEIHLRKLIVSIGPEQDG